jgi:uncharacterized coiled-coil DUF342 family protein
MSTITTKQLLETRMAELRADVDAVKAKSETLRAERDKWNSKASEANGKANDLTTQIDAIEQPTLAGKKAEISAIAAALGSLKLNG